METPKSSADFRKTPRPPQNKAFAMNQNYMMGESNVQEFKKYPEFQSVEHSTRTCLMYAAAYTSTMLERIKNEQPDFFDDKDYTEQEITAKINHNMCLEVS